MNIKLLSLKCLWVSMCENFHEGKIIPLQYINKLFGKSFKFHSNFNIPKNIISYFPSFYKDILKFWSKHYSNQPSLPSTIISQNLWFDSFIKIAKWLTIDKVVFHRKCLENNILLKKMENSKHGSRSFMNLKLIRICISNGFKLVYAIPNYWKKTLTENTTNSQNLSYLNHHLIKSDQIHSVEKLTMKELYLILLQHDIATPTSQKYSESMFWDLTLNWKHTYTLPRITTIDSKLQCFQYKILYNAPYLNQKFFLFLFNTQKLNNNSVQ